MKDIDFLPSRYRQRKAARKVQLWRLAVVALLGGVIATAALAQLAIRFQVQRELMRIQPQFAAAQAQQQQMSRLMSDLESARATASLYAYLKHPWPRTQILAAVIDPLPEAISLSQLQITRMAPVGAPVVRTAPRPGQAAQEEAELAKMLPAQRDLVRLRKRLDGMQLVVNLQGSTADPGALHKYLAEVGASAIVSKAELRSIEKQQRDAPQGTLQFTAQVIIRPGYGQPSGPKGPAAEAPPANRTARSVP